MGIDRRSFNTLVAGSALGLGGKLWAQAPAVITPDRARPAIPDGVASGDVGMHSAVVWARTDRPARMVVEYATTEAFRDPRRVVGPAALPETDYTAKLVLTGLPAGQQIFYRVLFDDLTSPGVLSLPSMGRFRT